MAEILKYYRLMNLRIPYKKLFVTSMLLMTLAAAFAGDRDSIVKKNTGSLVSAIERATDEINLNTRSFNELDQYIASQQFFIEQDNAGFTKEFFDDFSTPDPSIEEERMKAKASLGEVEANNSYVDFLSPSDINQLPIGLKKKVGNTDVTIAVSSAVFTTKYAELTLFARVKIPQGSGELFFGIKGLKLSYKGGIIGDAKLVLLGNVAIPINGNNAALVLKGGINMNTGQGEDKTYITIDCNGFKELGITADVQFPRSLIVPVDAAGNAVAGNVTAGINNLRISNWNDIISTISFDKSFQLNGLKGIIFNVTNAAFDLSDYRNNPDIVYPQGYQQKYLQAENINTWRGVYVKEFSVSLPKAFKDKDRPNELISFGVNDLLIDNNGISGIFYAKNILPITKGNASGWKFSVDSIRLAIEANRLLRAGFGGKIGLPVNNDYDTANKGKFLAYSAIITASADYVCRVNTMDSIDFDLLRAKVILKPNSYVQLTGNPNGFKPEAMLHGSMGVFIQSTDDKPRNDPSKAVGSFKGIEFTALHLKTEGPKYISAEYFGYKGDIKFGNFPVSLTDIGLDTHNDEVALKFGLKINLNDENEFTGSTKLRVVGKIDNAPENKGIQTWKYSRLEIEEIVIHADIKSSFTLDGRVKFMDDDPVFGDGFAGSIKAEFKKGINVKVDVNAIFGKKETFRYWYVDGKADLGTGIGSPIKLQGFGGGAYYRMKKQGYDPAFSPTGVKYIPDSTAALGVKAAVLFSVGDKKLANGEASFEMAFNKGGGVRYIGFFGFVKVLNKITIPGGVEDFVAGRFKDVGNKLNSLGADAQKALENLKMTDPAKAAKQENVGTEKPGDEGLSAYIGIQYNFDKNELHANFDMYINAAGGLLRGIGDDYRAGWAVLHIDPQTWYLHMGTPTNPIGVKIGVGSLSIRTTSYFMAGHNLPAFPSPPQKVMEVLRQSGLSYVHDISTNDLAGGRGLAFGAGINVNTGDLRFLVFYANFAAGLGFDVMLKDYGDAHCQGSSNRIGVNGWYAHGQAYAYLQGELGIRVKIGPIKKRISIIKGGAGALLQAKLPNPTWVGGSMGFYVRILGGLIKGRFSFKFSFGNDCVIVDDDGVADENIAVIEELAPDDNATAVSVLVTPRVKFRISPDEEMEIPKEDGSGNEYFKAKVESFKLYQGTNVIPATLKYSEDGTELSLKPNDVLSSNTAYKIAVVVVFQQKINGKWVGLSENGVKVEEKKEFTFTTGLAPDTLAYSLLQRMYPFFDQRNFYKDEPNKGVIKLNQRFPAYFAKFGKWKVKVETLEGMEVVTNYATTKDDSLFTFALPSNLNTNTTYRLLLLGEEPTDPSSDINKPGLKFTFTTSQYGSLSSKIQALRLTQPIVGRVSSDVIDLQAGVNNYEGFELYEIAGDKYTEYKPMIQGEINTTGETYYNTFIKPLIYPNYPDPIVTPDETTIAIQNADALVYGAPPFKAVTPSWYYITSLGSKAYNDLLRTRMPFVYNANKYYNLHFLELRMKLINKYIGQLGLLVDPSEQSQIPDEFKKLVNEAFPFMMRGEYKTRLTFVQLDGTRGTTGEFIYQNPLE